jgi:hypothetical protein
MKHPGDIIYLLKYVGSDVGIVAVVILIMVLVAGWYFLEKRK